MNKENDTYVLLERSDLAKIGDVISVLRGMIGEIKWVFKSKIIAILNFNDDEKQNYFVISCKDFNHFLQKWGVNTTVRSSLMNLRKKFEWKPAIASYDKNLKVVLSKKAVGIMLQNSVQNGWDFQSIRTVIEKANEIDVTHLGEALKIAVRDESTPFSDIVFMLEKAKKIKSPHLGEALKVAMRDESTGFSDIAFMLKKADEIESHHLGEALKVAMRDESTGFSDIAFMLKKADEIDVVNLGEALKIAVRDGSTQFNNIAFMLEKANKIEEHHNRIIQIIKNRTA